MPPSIYSASRGIPSRDLRRRTTGYYPPPAAGWICICPPAGYLVERGIPSRCLRRRITGYYSPPAAGWTYIRPSAMSEVFPFEVYVVEPPVATYLQQLSEPIFILRRTAPVSGVLPVEVYAIEPPTAQIMDAVLCESLDATVALDHRRKRIWTMCPASHTEQHLQVGVLFLQADHSLVKIWNVRRVPRYTSQCLFKRIW